MADCMFRIDFSGKNVSVEFRSLKLVIRGKIRTSKNSASDGSRPLAPCGTIRCLNVFKCFPADSPKRQQTHHDHKPIAIHDVTFVLPPCDRRLNIVT
jgi:hypothetical protein